MPYEHEELKNCTEATMKIKNGSELYNCTKCSKHYSFTLNKYTGTYHF